LGARPGLKQSWQYGGGSFTKKNTQSS